MSNSKKDQNGRGPNKIVTADFFTDLKDYKIEKIYIPEWQADVYIREISAVRRDAMEDKMERSDEGMEVDLGNARARMSAYSMCDPTGVFLFENPEEAAKKLGERNGAAVNRIFWDAMKLNKMRNVDLLEEIKNSKPSQGVSSNID